MRARRTAMVGLILALTLAFLFLVPVVAYSLPPGTYDCPANGCQFVRYGSVAYWALGVGATVRDVKGYSLEVVTTTAAVSSTSSISYTVSSTCIGLTTTDTVLNGTSTTIQTCSVTQVVLGAGRCYGYSNGSSLCVQGAPSGSIADSYNNGTIVVTYPNGYRVNCEPTQGQGPCFIGIP